MAAGEFNIEDIFASPRMKPEKVDLPAKGKVRSRALKKALESRPLVSAIKHPETGRITRGLPGESHYDVIEREAKRRGIGDDYNKIDEVIDEYFKPKKGAVGQFDQGTGFSHARTGEYFTREEAGKILKEKTGMGTGESRAAAEAQAQIRPEVAKREVRRGLDVQEAERLLKKRKQTGRLLHNLNEGIAKASTDPVKTAKLLNRRGLVRSIARKNRYLGVALAAGEAINSMFGQTEK